MDAPQSGAPRTVKDAEVDAVMTRTLESTPKNATASTSTKIMKRSNRLCSPLGRGAADSASASLTMPAGVHSNAQDRASVISRPAARIATRLRMAASVNP